MCTQQFRVCIKCMEIIVYTYTMISCTKFMLSFYFDVCFTTPATQLSTPARITGNATPALFRLYNDLLTDINMDNGSSVTGNSNRSPTSCATMDILKQR